MESLLFAINLAVLVYFSYQYMKKDNDDKGDQA